MPHGRAAIDELTQILALSAGTAAGAHLQLDPTLARGLGYYTGAIFEIAVADLAGSLGGGGRYDDLVGMFLGQRVPACGMSLGLERILVVMGERGMFPAAVERPPADVLVANFDAAAVAETLALAAALRAGADGIRLAVELFPDVDKLGKQFKYAAERGVPVRGGDGRGRTIGRHRRDQDPGKRRAGRGAARRGGRAHRLGDEDFSWLNNSVPWPARTPAAPCAPRTSAPTSCCSAGCRRCATSARSSSSTCAIGTA